MKMVSLVGIRTHDDMNNETPDLTTTSPWLIVKLSNVFEALRSLITITKIAKNLK